MRNSTINAFATAAVVAVNLIATSVSAHDMVDGAGNPRDHIHVSEESCPYLFNMLAELDDPKSKIDKNHEDGTSTTLEVGTPEREAAVNHLKNWVGGEIARRCAGFVSP